MHVVDTGAERVGDGDLRDRPRPVHRPRPLDPRPGRARDATGRCRARPARCSIRSSRSGRGSGSSPGQSASVAFTTLVAATRDRAFELADRYHDPHAAQRALDLAWTSSQVELRELEHHAGRRGRVPGAGRPPLLRQPGAAARRRPSSGATAARSRCSGPSASRATGRSSWPRSTRGRAADPAAAPRGASLLAPARDDGGPRRSSTRTRRATSRTWRTGSPRRSSPRATRARSTGSGGVFVRRTDLLTADALAHAARHRAGAHLLRRPGAGPDPGRRDGRRSSRRTTSSTRTSEPRAPARSDSRVIRRGQA